MLDAFAAHGLAFGDQSGREAVLRAFAASSPAACAGISMLQKAVLNLCYTLTDPHGRNPNWTATRRSVHAERNADDAHLRPFNTGLCRARHTVLRVYRAIMHKTHTLGVQEAATWDVYAAAALAAIARDNPCEATVLARCAAEVADALLQERRSRMLPSGVTGQRRSVRRVAAR